MIKLSQIPRFSVLFAIAVFCSCSQNPQYLIETSKGVIEIETYPQYAPITCENFQRYVEAGKYDNTTFFRTCTEKNESDREIRIQVIQSSVLDEGQFDPIEIETTKQTGILHTDGVLSMARDLPNSATNSFFICLGDQPSLDYKGMRNPDGYGFAAFGKVIRGMDVVREINELPNQDQVIDNLVIIKSIQHR